MLRAIKNIIHLSQIGKVIFYFLLERTESALLLLEVLYSAMPTLEAIGKSML